MLERVFARQIPGVGINRRAPQVGRKLRMLLTMQFALIPGQAMKGGVLIGQRRAHSARYFRERRLILGQIAFIHEGELHQGAR